MTEGTRTPDLQRDNPDHRPVTAVAGRQATALTWTLGHRALVIAVCW